MTDKNEETREYKAISAMVDILENIIYEIEHEEPNKNLSYIKRDICELWSKYKND